MYFKFQGEENMSILVEYESIYLLPVLKFEFQDETLLVKM